MYHIETPEEFNLIMNRGHNPLFISDFTIDINLRIDIQREFFGHSVLSKGNIPQANERFYRYMWENKPHYCEECLKPLQNYSSAFISHILSRGSSPEIAHDVRNINILCLPHHNQWENGKKEAMRIYPVNVKTINTLKTEYANKEKH
jgi:hypothetical protein